MSGGTNIKIDTRKIKETAKIIENQSSIIMSCFTGINDELKSLSANSWKGDSADAYIGNMIKLCSNQYDAGTVNAESIMRTLREYSDYLNGMVTAFDRNEQKQENKMNSLKTKIFVV